MAAGGIGTRSSQHGRRALLGVLLFLTLLSLWISSFCVIAQRVAGDPVTAEEGLEDNLACSKQLLTPLNNDFFLSEGLILSTLYSITSCSAASLSENGIGPCLYDLGFEGLELEEGETDWSCTNAQAPNSCSGLKCDQYHLGTVTYGCVFSVFRSVNSETVAGENEGALLTGYFAVPVGCTYNENWNPEYPCIGGMEWNAFASACPETCHYIPNDDTCSPNGVPRCACPEDTPIWDRFLGCTTREVCDSHYGDLPELSSEDRFKPVKPAVSFTP